MLHIRSMACLGIPSVGHRVALQIVLGHVGAPAARFARRGLLRPAERFGEQPCARPAVTKGSLRFTWVQQRRAWGLNCALLGWARFPMGTLLGRTLILSQHKQGLPLWRRPCSCLHVVVEAILCLSCPRPRTPWWSPRCWRRPGRTCAGARHPGRTRRRCR